MWIIAIGALIFLIGPVTMFGFGQVGIPIAAMVVGSLLVIVGIWRMLRSKQQIR